MGFIGSQFSMVVNVASDWDISLLSGIFKAVHVSLAAGFLLLKYWKF